jgi:lysophospholipase L1-like esterase
VFRRLTVVLGLVLVIALSVPASSAAALDVPTSMAALGDSITTAYNAGPGSYQDYPAGSWSTGTVLYSHASLLGLTGTAAINNAVSGAKMSDLITQAKRLPSGVKYVTILMGGNDLCTKTEATMTLPDAFGRDFEAALSEIPSTVNVFVASIPRVKTLWEVLYPNGSARFIWSLFGICQSLLANPGVTTGDDAARRARVDARNVELNTQLATVCARPPRTNCRFDAGLTVYKTRFAAGNVSTRDYFHPNASGQKLLACTAWKASYWAATKSC